MVVGAQMDPFARSVLAVFKDMGSDRLDLHALFEAGGNEPHERIQVLDTIQVLIRSGILESTGSDFYSLTEKGKNIILNDRNGPQKS